MNIYVASSWRNKRQPAIVAALRLDDHQVYDFRNPPNRQGFAWSQIDPNWEKWTIEEYIQYLAHPKAIAGFLEDINALYAAEVTVLVMPCGRSAHLELGYASGTGQHTAILADSSEPELMYKMVDLITPDIAEIIDWLRTLHK